MTLFDPTCQHCSLPAAHEGPHALKRETAPFVAHSDTSRDAARAAVPKAGTQRARVYECIEQEGPLTDERIQKLLAMNPSTQRPRRVELCEQGLICRAERDGTTASGRRAARWMAT